LRFAPIASGCWYKCWSWISDWSFWPLESPVADRFPIEAHTMATMLALLFGPLLLQAPAGQPQRLKSSSELVVLSVTVVDRRSGYVAGLGREAFTVYDDGTPQQLSFFDDANIPVTAGLVIDTSISMYRRRDAIVAAGSSFVESSHPEDELFTVHFNERVWPGLPDGQLFTSDREVLRRALSQMVPRGRTALFDGLQLALNRLGQGQCTKKVLIVVSDGGDNASKAKFEEVLATALRTNAVIYTVTIPDQYEKEDRPDVLRKLASVTGGEAFFLRSVSDITPTFQRIARDIRSGYIIGYVPPSPAAGYHAIRVVVQPPDRRKVTVRARAGYQK
jgi:Ca-activated chloride channel homolog